MESWEWVASESGRALLTALVGTDRTAATTIERARSIAPPEMVTSALALLDARERARGKIDRAEDLLADRVAVEQSTSTDVARYKARRLRAAGVTTFLDLCCGLGGDAIGAVLEGLSPILVDRDPARVRAARHNVGLFTDVEPSGVVADLERWPGPGFGTNGGSTGESDGNRPAPLPFHLDPDRRPGGQRSWRYEDLLPGPETIERWLASGAPGAVKLGPGVDFDSLPVSTRAPHDAASGGAGLAIVRPTEIEVIQRGRGLVQTVLWCGACATVPRRATRLVSPGIVSFTGEPGPVPIRPLPPPSSRSRLETMRPPPRSSCISSNRRSNARGCSARSR